MHHDNIRLFDEGHDMAHYHTAGLVPGLVSHEAHQHVAVATAVAASQEWLAKLSEHPDVRLALTSASRIKGSTQTMQDESHMALEAVARVSCLPDREMGR
jgi:hypothetical protein